ncbi:hypothetical protein AVEN_119730-1 [Araneus ventricosus]|uniref:Uncharacterized protein n=1 Tax=Araneus ventricosus TaxID=182803 RepID=A0A4Y2HKH2_ARAVE|nr:hypothetical protein AVEN_119730-1 [Araneus ventricosus]
MSSHRWRGSLERKVQVQVPSSTSDHGSELRHSCPNSPNVDLKRDADTNELNHDYLVLTGHHSPSRQAPRVRGWEHVRGVS